MLFELDVREIVTFGCTSAVLIDEFDLGDDPALVWLAATVHAADINQNLDTDPLSIGIGGLVVEAGDHRLLEGGILGL